MKNQIRAALTSILIATTLAGLITGCGSAGRSAKTMALETTAAASMDTAGYAESYQSQAFGEQMAEYNSDYTESGALTTTNAIQPAASNRKLIRNVSLSVETTSFDALISDLTGTVSGYGGYIEQSDISGNSVSSSYDGNRYAYLTVRIPSDKLDLFITKLGNQGSITSKSESTQDVTLQYSDIESRKKSLTIEQERIWALLEKADTLEAVIALEARLSEIRYQLEAFESQLRTYDNQVDFSTVSINISEVKVFTPTAPDSVTTRIQKGFHRNLSNVSNGLVDFFVWLISSLPVLIPLAAIFVIAFLITRSILKSRPPKNPRRGPRYEKKSFWNRHSKASKKKTASKKESETPDESSISQTQPLPPLNQDPGGSQWTANDPEAPNPKTDTDQST